MTISVTNFQDTGQRCVLENEIIVRTLKQSISNYSPKGSQISTNQYDVISQKAFIFNNTAVRIQNLALVYHIVQANSHEISNPA